jgi:molecular chaperone GrpE (heat shock protein)
MFPRLFKIFRKRPLIPEPPDPLAPVLAELHDLKKQARRQNLFLDAMKSHLTKAILDQRRPELEAYYALADAFFYHAQALAPTAPEQLETLDMIWERVDSLLSSVGVQMLRQVGENFDAPLHDAVANQAQGASHLVVLQVIQPGYLFNSLLAKPAKVIVGDHQPLPTE